MLLREPTVRATHARILLVEDSPSNRYVVSTWLRRAGYEVVEAATGAEGLRLISQCVADLAILDVNLPDMSGYDLCKYIKAHERTSDVPVLHISATAVRAADRSEGLRGGAEGYLVEPVEPEVLIATVEALLRGAAAQREARRLAKRLEQLNESTLALSRAVEIQELLDVIARQAALLFESTVFTVLTFNGSGRVTLARNGQLQTRPCTIEAVADAQRLAISGPRLELDPLRMFVEPPGSSAYYLAATLGDGQDRPGSIFVEVPRERTAAPEDVALLSQYARAASTALRNLYSYDVEHRIAITLQRHLLPDAAPVLAGLEIVTRYAASEIHAQVGGDFHEVFELGNDRVVAAIGDVVGHSLEAAAVMAQLRTAIRCYALGGRAPVEILERINDLLLKFHDGVTATACCLIYDKATGRCDIANAGHVPPFHATDAHSPGAFLPVGGTLLGVKPFHVPAHVITLAPGDLLVMYTDGLVERRGEAIDVGLRRLAGALQDSDAPVESLCERLLERVAPSNITDDIAILALRRNIAPSLS